MGWEGEERRVGNGNGETGSGRTRERAGLICKLMDLFKMMYSRRDKKKIFVICLATYVGMVQ